MSRRPAVGAKLLSGSSALIRHSIACPRKLDVLLRDRQLLARGDADLLLDQVAARDHLAHRVLDLDPRVHLHEGEVPVVVEQELHGAGARVADRQRARDGLLADVLAHLRRQVRGRRLLDQLLMAPLHRAVALPEVDAVAVRVADELHLGVARRLEVPLDVDGASP